MHAKVDTLESLGAFDDLVRLICEDEVSIQYSNTDWAVDVNVAASENDVKRLVGADGATFKALCVILRAITHHFGKQFTLAPIAKISNGPSTEFAAFAPRSDWQRDSIVKLVTVLASAAFPKGNPTVTCQDSPGAEGFRSDIALKLDTELKAHAHRFGLAMARVLLVAGMKVGRMIHATLDC